MIQAHISDRFIERVSSSSSGGLGGGGGKMVLWYFIIIFSCPSCPSHYIVGLITGGLELIWISGVRPSVVAIENQLTLFHMGRLTHILPLRTWRAPLID